jgi:fructokinase
MGHIALTRAVGDHAASTCQFHRNCAEGLAAGPAIKARFGEPLSAFAPFSTQHTLVADYLGQVCANLVLTLSPQRIILGGGVFKAEALIEQTHTAMTRHLNGYATRGTLDADFLSAPHLGEHAGIVGALCAAAHTAQGVREVV